MFESVIDLEEFAQRLWAGDPDTYDFVWREARNPIIRLLVSRGASLEDAEDIVSLWWIKIKSSYCKTYKPNVGPPDRWFIAVAINLWADLLRDYEEREDSSIDDVEDLLISDDPLNEADSEINDINDQEKSGDWRFALLEQALGSAQESDVEAITLHYRKEYTYSQMSRMLGISNAAAGMRVTRAVKRLRKEVKRLQSDEPRRGDKGPDEEDSS